MRRGAHILITRRNGAAAHEGRLITTGHPAENLPAETRQVLVWWWRGPNAGVSGWVAWLDVARWVQ